MEVYPLIMTNSLRNGKIHQAIKFGKPSISMDHLYHGYVSHNQRVYLNIYFMAIFSSSLSSRKKHREELVPWLFSTSISYGSKSGWWFRPTPLKNMSSSVGVTIIPNIWKKWKNKTCSKPPTK